MDGSHKASRAPRRNEEPFATVGAAAVGKMVVVSPHLDDAVLGCGDLLAGRPGTCVLTVFAGHPAGGSLTEWDRLCGFQHAAEVLPARKEEDLLALFLLDAYPLWLDFLDAQYASRPTVQEVAAAMRTAIDAQRADSVIFPLGLFHDDHRIAADAALHLCRSLSGLRWIAYADALYRRLPGLVEQRLQSLRSSGWRLQPLTPPSRDPAKRRAVDCYASQLRALASPGHVATEQAFEPEAYWTLAAAT